LDAAAATAAFGTSSFGVLGRTLTVRSRSTGVAAEASIEDWSSCVLRHFAALQLKPALAAGLLSPADIDTAVNRTLAMRFITGQFDTPRLNPWGELPISTVNGRMSRLLARNVVQKGEQHTQQTYTQDRTVSNTSAKLMNA
jgi:hypothetical protein